MSKTFLRVSKRIRFWRKAVRAYCEKLQNDRGGVF